MIRVIDAEKKPKKTIAEGRVKDVLAPSEDGTRVHVAIADVDQGKAYRVAASRDRTQIAYILEGKDARITHTRAGASTEHVAQRRAGVYLEPGEEATVNAAGSALVLFLLTVPKHTAKAVSEPAAGYFFEEAQLRALVDEKRIRERTFWVNKETGLSGSWDLQLGRMYYAPQGYSPRHVHHASKTSAITPEHFYFIEKGTGEVKDDQGTQPIGPGSLVLIPAGEWHQLIASDSGLDYIEFQAPFDFVTTMDRDPLGKNWYIKGTDDGTGKPKLWVQS
jgi:mannose-6-phosphate isomerase-like protein (cupin superfamily)